MEDNQSSYGGESSPEHDDQHDYGQEDAANAHLNPNLVGKKNYYLDPSTFLTSVNQVEKGPKKLDEHYVPNASEINSCHSQLNTLVNVCKSLFILQDLGIKISDVIKGHENDFFIAFKNKMYAIMKEMRELKEKASSERHKAKQEARLVNLEKERDWFRKEALKLDKICKDHKRILNKLKATLENIEEDRDFFQEQLFNAKKVNKALLMEVEKYKKAITSGSQGIENSQLQLGQSQQPLALMNEDPSRSKYSASRIKNKVDAILGKGSGLKEDFDSDREEDEFDENEFEEMKSNKPSYKPDYKVITGQSTQQKLRQSSSRKPPVQDMVTYDSQLGSPTPFTQEDYIKLQKEVHELRDKESKYVDTIKHLKNQIDNEKKLARTLRADKVNFMTQRNELEEFFLQCIEEVRKEIVKRKTISSYSSKRGMKKSTSQASLKEDYNAKLDNFTATDKRKVIELLMSNENVLLFLYEKLFPVSTMSQQSTQSRQNTAPYSQNPAQKSKGEFSANAPFRFMTDSGIPIQTQNRSQTAVGGQRMNFKGGQGQESQQMPFTISQDLGSQVSGALQSVMPSGTPGANIQNNIQNINLNINMAKGGYGSQPYIPQKIVRGSTAPLGQQRTKKSYQTQLNAVVGNKYQL